MLILNDKNFEEVVMKNDKPVLVDFWASYCFPCFILTPILEKLTEEFQGKFISAKANLDEVKIFAQKYRIDRVPTIVLFKGGRPVSRFVGILPEEEIKKWIEENLKNNDKDYNPPSSFSAKGWAPKIEKIIKEYEEYAVKNNFKLNSNRGVVERIIRGLLANEKEYGQRYCPCRRISGNPEDDKSEICPCAYHRLEIKRDGHCFCKLFVK